MVLWLFLMNQGVDKMKKIKCLICGMMINHKNYGLNASTFMAENTDGNIVRCPFCGATEAYLSNEDALLHIPDNLSIDMRKILDMGMKLEIFNGEFYEAASQQAQSKELQVLFKELSKIEWMHARVHKLFGGFDTLPSLRVPDYSRHNTDKLLLAEAQKREAHAIEFYQRYYDQVPEVIQQVFNGLMEVEREHMMVTEIKE